MSSINVGSHADRALQATFLEISDFNAWLSNQLLNITNQTENNDEGIYVKARQNILLFIF